MSEYSKQYYQKHRDEILRRQKEQTAEKKQRIAHYWERRAQGEHIPYEERQALEALITREYMKYIEHCRKVLGVYAYRSMERARLLCGDAVLQYFERYPFEQFGEPQIKRELIRHSIFKNRAEYDDCYDAGMLAYLYSIHRCAAKGCHYVSFYVQKMIRIYVQCARVVYRDAHNICKLYHFREVNAERSRITNFNSFSQQT